MASVDGGIKYKGLPLEKERGLRAHAEWIHLNKCPVGYTAVPYPVGGNGDIFHLNVEMTF